MNDEQEPMADWERDLLREPPTTKERAINALQARMSWAQAEGAVNDLQNAGLLKADYDPSFGAGEKRGLPDFITPDRYIDLAQRLTKASSYRDFEGFADGPPILNYVDEIMYSLGFVEADENDKAATVRTLLVHWTHENLEAVDTIPSTELGIEVATAFDWLLNVRYWLKETAT